MNKFANYVFDNAAWIILAIGIVVTMIFIAIMSIIIHTVIKKTITKEFDQLYIRLDEVISSHEPEQTSQSAVDNSISRADIIEVRDAIKTLEISSQANKKTLHKLGQYISAIYKLLKR